MTNIFSNALSVVEEVCQQAKFDEKLVNYLANPEHFLCVNFPVQMDNGSTRYFKGYRSRYSTLLGPAKGGIRYHSKVDEHVVNALALWMALKTSLVGLPYGGGKGGVIVDPKTLSKSELERLSRAYIKAVYQSVGEHIDVPACDIGTNQQTMHHMIDEYEKIVGRKASAMITGKPVEMGGSLFRKEATGYGVFQAVEKTVANLNMQPKDTTLAIQGLGNVGFFAAKFLSEKEYKIVSISDHTSAVHNPNGLDIKKILNLLKNKTLVEIENDIKDICTKITNEDLLSKEVDGLILAAIDNVIVKNNVSSVKAKFIIEGANGPISPECEPELIKKGMIIVPDILANAGGVIVSYFEWVQNLQGMPWSEEEVISKLNTYFLTAYDKVWNYAKENKVSLKTSAYVMSLKRMNDALTFGDK